VIFTGQPENRDVRTSGGRGLTGAGDGGRGFEGREQRTTEKSYLLPGYNNSRALP
jgi:hypothetical protein